MARDPHAVSVDRGFSTSPIVIIKDEGELSSINGKRQGVFAQMEDVFNHCLFYHQSFCFDTPIFHYYYSQTQDKLEYGLIYFFDNLQSHYYYIF